MDNAHKDRNLLFDFPVRTAYFLVGVVAGLSACSAAGSFPAHNGFVGAAKHIGAQRNDGRSHATGEPLTANAGPADAFAGAIGVDTHFGYTTTVYKYLTSPAPSGNTIISSLKGLGVRHIRDGSIDTEPSFCPAYRTAIANGSDVDAITTTTTDVTAMKKIVTCLGNGLFAIEGPNELDQSGKPTWAQMDVNEMSLLHSNRGSAYPASVKIFAPSTTSEAAYQALAAINGDSEKGFVDVANAHVYFSAREPETLGWGGTDRYGTYGALSTTRNWSLIPAPGKPWTATETGYPDASSDAGYVPATIKSKYIVRDMLRHWQDGAEFIYVYELADENGSWGLMDDKLYPKPAYTALQNLITVLADRGPAIAPGYLAYSVTAGSDVQHLLFNKRDGSFWLCLWQDDEGWNPNTNQPIIVAPTTATVTFGSLPSALKKYQISPITGRMTVTALKPATSITTAITDSPAIVQINTTAKAPQF